MNRYASLAPLPERIARLHELAIDLWWSWHPAREVFRRLDYPLWRTTAHNPVRMLWTFRLRRSRRQPPIPEFLALYDRAIDGARRCAGGAQHLVDAHAAAS